MEAMPARPPTPVSVMEGARTRGVLEEDIMACSGSFVRRLCAVLVVAILVAGAAQAGLLGVHWDTGDLYEISTTDASLTLIGNTGLTSPEAGSLEFRPSDGTLFAFTTNDTARVNPILS